MNAKILVTFLFCCCSFFGMTQVVVNDPQANAALMQQITNSLKTVEQTTKTVNILKETKEMYDDINSALQTFNYITDMTSKTTKILENSGKFLQEIQRTNMFSSSEMASITKEFSGLMNKSNTTLKMANDLLKGGIFKMNDAERVTLLKQSNQEMNETLVDTQISRRRYMRIAERRSYYQYFASQKRN